MGPKARKEIKEKNKLLVDEEPEADVLHVNLDPAEVRRILQSQGRLRRWS